MPRNLSLRLGHSRTTMPLRCRKRSAQLKIWVECPRCGSTDKLTREFQLPLSEASTRVEKVGFPCERCAMRAYMVFKRTVTDVH